MTSAYEREPHMPPGRSNTVHPASGGPDSRSSQSRSPAAHTALIVMRLPATLSDSQFAGWSQPLVTVSIVAEHDYEVSCECGAQWRVRLEYDDDAIATCLACGADTSWSTSATRALSRLRR